MTGSVTALGNCRQWAADKSQDGNADSSSLNTFHASSRSDGDIQTGLFFESFGNTGDDFFGESFRAFSRKMNVGRFLNFFEAWFAESKEVIRGDFIFRHDLGCDGIVFVTVPDFSAAGAFRNGCG